MSSITYTLDRQLSTEENVVKPRKVVLAGDELEEVPEGLRVRKDTYDLRPRPDTPQDSLSSPSR